MMTQKYVVTVEHLCAEACEIEVEAASPEEAIDKVRGDYNLLAEAQWSMTDYVGKDEFHVWED